MTVTTWRSLRVAGIRIPGGLRLAHVGFTLLISLLGLVAFLHVPPFMAAGADLSDSSQGEYAQNIWQEVQTSLALVALVLPWLVYALLWPGAAWGRRILLVVSTAAVVFATYLALASAQSYTALPRQVAGVVAQLQGRSISLQGEGSYYLVLTDAQLSADATWLRPGTQVLLWVSPRGHVGAVERAVLGN